MGEFTDSRARNVGGVAVVAPVLSEIDLATSVAALPSAIVAIWPICIKH